MQHGDIRELSEEDLAKLGYTPLSPDEFAREQERRETQMRDALVELREIAEARIGLGWAPDLAFEDAVHRAAKVGTRREATIQMMTLVASELAQGWTHSAAFVEWWNRLFDGAERVSGFAAPCILTLPDGRRGTIAATWSDFLSQRKADA